MAEYGYPIDQTVEGYQNVIFNNEISCPYGIVLHENGSGLFTLNTTGNHLSRYSRFLAIFTGNVAIPEGGTPGPIELGFSINGEIDQSTLAIVTPTVAEAFFNVACAKYITIPNCCCTQLAVGNVLNSPITVRKPRLIIMPAK